MTTADDRDMVYTYRITLDARTVDGDQWTADQVADALRARLDECYPQSDDGQVVGLALILNEFATIELVDARDEAATS